MLRRDNIESANAEMKKIPSIYDAVIPDGATLAQEQVWEALASYNMVEELMTMPSSAACWTAITEAGVYVLTGEKTVEEALADAQAEWDAILGQ